MKPLVVLILLVGLTVSGFAQKVFGISNLRMKDTLANYGYHYSQSKIDENNIPFDIFMGDDGVMASCFYNKNGICFKYTQVMLKKELIGKIEYLNKYYIKVDDRDWISKNTNVKAQLYISNNDWIEITFEFISLKD